MSCYSFADFAAGHNASFRAAEPARRIFTS